ncbi:membrane protein [Microbacterium phage Cece]|nr:membrane protein [Microbacterium phage Cece]
MELTFWQDVVEFFRSLRLDFRRPSRKTIFNIIMIISVPFVFLGALAALILLVAIFVEGLSPLLFLLILAWGVVAALLVLFSNYYEDKYKHTWS